MSRYRILDLFCGAGGAAMGYHRAGFDVVGVDIAQQKNYPFEFHQADALTFPLDGFDAVHASPPCQSYSTLDRLNRSKGNPSKQPRLIGPIRERLERSGLPYVIENVEGSPLAAFRLCGSSFGLGVRRHRLFESRPLFIGIPPCAHAAQPTFVGVYSDHPQIDRPHPDGYSRQPRAGTLDQGRVAMGIDWMTWTELVEAIPPAFTEWIGQQLLAEIERRAAA